MDACLVIGAEETNWILADALWHLERPAVITGGAGALCLCREPELSAGVELAAITDAHTYSRSQPAGRKPPEPCAVNWATVLPEELLCDGVGSSPRADAPELAAWRDWTGPRLSPKRILGEGLMAAAAWQCVAACDAVAGGRFAGGQRQPGRLQSAGDGRAVCACRFRHFSFVRRWIHRATSRPAGLKLTE